ncbi:MAG: nucleotidyl transferase AbiEii/AbiGii toxin family protein [Candidatus Izimaplasma sp.]|nr:nucleotidyl transferase AbiEii/AbiGii toxin family protein [Candidatus Izimaplasma bacterium]
MMNKHKLTALIHKVSKEKGVSFNILLQVYFFERFLDRLANSKYKKSLILKGGFLLSSLLGITERSTIDMDFSVSSIEFNKENMREVIHKIIQVDLKDDISFQISDITEIIALSTYVGYQISLIGKLDNIKVPFHIDLATGDPITPDKITYKYKQIIDRNIIEIKSYTVETVLAEKLQTIMDKRIGNSRMKDFYDIYILMKLHKNLFDIKVLDTAIKTTFEYRNSTIDKTEFKELLRVLEEDNSFVSRWNNFTNKNHYVDCIDFKDVKLEIFKLIDYIE